MIKFEKVSKKFYTDVFVLEGINLKVEKGEFAFVVGPTGSGKTTLLRLLIRDLLPTQGKVFVEDWDLARLPHSKIPALRKKIGVVFQDLKLLMDRTVFENVALALEVGGVKEEKIKSKVEEVLKLVGLEKHLVKFPLELSGGELQRTAIARALVGEPEVLLADEPTGNLDLETSWEIVKLFEELNKKGTTIIMATHNVDIVNNLGRRVIALEKGKLTRDEKKGKYAA
ncbi:cell division ATP-binding protein FtsE [Candidatus Microgenomates bacterium]|nr:cell division ATP-binding protein FtsE [Candidatus Microgenomates bacterium]